MQGNVLSKFGGKKYDTQFTSTGNKIKYFMNGIGAMTPLLVSMVTWCLKPGLQKIVTGAYSRGTHGSDAINYMTGLHPP